MEALANGTHASPPAANVPFATHTLSVSMDFLTMKTTIIVTSGGSVTFDISGPEGPKGPSIMRMLGYDGPGYSLTNVLTTQNNFTIAGTPVWTLTAGITVINITLPDGTYNYTLAEIATWLMGLFAAQYTTTVYTFVATIDAYGAGCTFTLHRTSDGAQVTFTNTVNVTPSTNVPPFNLLGLATATTAINLSSERPLYTLLTKTYTAVQDFESHSLLNIHHFRSIFVLCAEAKGNNTQLRSTISVPTWMDGIVDTFGLYGEVGDILNHSRKDNTRWTKLSVKKPFEALHIHLATDTSYIFGPSIVDWTFVLEVV